MENIVEQTNAQTAITTDAPEGTPMTIFGVQYGKPPADKVTLGTFTAPAPNTEQPMILQTSELTIGTYFLEVWADFGTDNQQRYIDERFQIINSNVI